MKLVLNNRDPVYLQVVNYFKQQLATGQLTGGQEVPSRRELAMMLNINPNTVQKAYKEMEDQKLIMTERNFPSKVTTDEAILQNVRKELIYEATAQYIRAMKQIAVPVEEVLDVVKEEFKKVQ
ncbi:GntR family transcriptional regulator [Bacillus sp. AGMB 02131]|uniref:GntR family transcriptional regulator n=1 Tax=Peribacillus faecalis TaxID=2772559 RepID=A0A927CSD4_9BACI|nr:GntR family transcriptional regulator [Peribacillus faecalis]MBD3107012.1 GntR family transcriptional regulator [Peribacillus faecalis]